MDEEGTRFNAALFGSRAFAGQDAQRRSATAPMPPARRCATRWREQGHALARIAEANRIGEIGAYLELHIEQGPVLEAEGVADRRRHLDRRAARLPRAAARPGRTTPGTTPMHMRRDAFIGAARIAVELRDVARRATT